MISKFTGNHVPCAGHPRATCARVFVWAGPFFRGVFFMFSYFSFLFLLCFPFPFLFFTSLLFHFLQIYFQIQKLFLFIGLKKSSNLILFIGLNNVHQIEKMFIKFESCSSFFENIRQIKIVHLNKNNSTIFSKKNVLE